MQTIPNKAIEKKEIPQRSPIDNLIDQGNHFYSQKAYDAAHKIFTDVMSQLSPSDHRYILAEGKIEKAEQSIDARASLKRGNSLAAAGKHKEALDCFAEAVSKLDPQDPFYDEALQNRDNTKKQITSDPTPLTKAVAPKKVDPVISAVTAKPKPAAKATPKKKVKKVKTAEQIAEKAARKAARKAAWKEKTALQRAAARVENKMRTVTPPSKKAVNSFQNKSKTRTIVPNVESTNTPVAVLQETTRNIAPTTNPFYEAEDETSHQQFDRDDSDTPNENLSDCLETETYQYREGVYFEEDFYDEPDFIEENFPQNDRKMEKRKNKKWDFGYLAMQYDCDY